MPVYTYKAIDLDASAVAGELAADTPRQARETLRARGLTIEEAQEEIQQVVEGVLAARAVHEVAERMQVEMPICQQIYRILYEGVPPREAVGALMGRALRPE